MKLNIDKLKSNLYPNFEFGINKYNKGGGLSRRKDYKSKSKSYPSVDKKDFAGSNRSYPIPSKADAIDALRLAGLHGRSDVKAKVYKKYPELKKHQNGGDINVRDSIKDYTKKNNFIPINLYRFGVNNSLVDTAINMYNNKVDISRSPIGFKEILKSKITGNNRCYGNPCFEGIKTIYKNAGLDSGIPDDVYDNNTFSKNFKKYGYEIIPKEKLQKGDLLQYYYSDKENKLGLNNYPYHIGIYIGNNEYISDGDKDNPLEKKNIYFNIDNTKKDDFIIYRKIKKHQEGGILNKKGFSIQIAGKNLENINQNNSYIIKNRVANDYENWMKIG